MTENKDNLSSIAVLYRSVFYIGMMFILTLIVPLCVAYNYGFFGLLSYVASLVALTFLNQGEFFVAMRQLIALIKYLPLLAPSSLFLIAAYFIFGDAPEFIGHFNQLNAIIFNLAMFFFGFLNIAAKAYAEDLTDNGYYWSSFTLN